MTEHPRDLASFRVALLEGDRRLVRRRRTRAAGGAAALVATALLVAFVAPLGGGALDAPAVAADARRALAKQGLVLHSETEVVLPGRRVQQRISRWTLGDRSRTISVADGRRVEQVVDERGIHIRLEPGGPIHRLERGDAPRDPLLAYRDALDHATAAEEVEVDGVEAYRLEIGASDVQVAQVVYLRRADRLPLRAELEGGVTLRYRVVEWLPADAALLELR